MNNDNNKCNNKCNNKWIILVIYTYCTQNDFRLYFIVLKKWIQIVLYCTQKNNSAELFVSLWTIFLHIYQRYVHAQ